MFIPEFKPQPGVALLSVYDKTGIVEFANGLIAMGWKIIASGGTAKVLREAGLLIGDVSELVHGEPILGHRVVTLSREIHAGLLAQDTHEHALELKKLGIPRIDLVCVDLYPLREAIEAPNRTIHSVIEMTDIGGPTLLRSAAKGNRIVISRSIDRSAVLRWLQKGMPNKEQMLRHLAARAEDEVARYCTWSAWFLSDGRFDGLLGERALNCKYGENPWQEGAAFYTAGKKVDHLALDKFMARLGTDPSYNNLCDLDRALQTMTHMAVALNAGPLAISEKSIKLALAVKHGNPCGAAWGFGLTEEADVVRRMVAGDPRAIFGGLVMTNFVLTDACVELLLHHGLPRGQKRVLDVVAAAGITEEALKLLERKNGKCRVMINSDLDDWSLLARLDDAPRFRMVRGGFLAQPNYVFALRDWDQYQFAWPKKTTSEEKLRLIEDMFMAWAIGSTSNSNTVTLVRDRTLIGNGVGQQDRVSCAELAVKRARSAGHATKGAVAYSDSFFPFVDGPEVLIKAGIAAIMVSSGSVNDEKVVKLCARRGIGLLMLPDAECRGFFGH